MCNLIKAFDCVSYKDLIQKIYQKKVLLSQDLIVDVEEQILMVLLLILIAIDV